MSQNKAVKTDYKTIDLDLKKDLRVLHWFSPAQPYPMAPTQIIPIQADGSQRRFFRCCYDNHPHQIFILPADTAPVHLAEAKATREIGRFLQQQGRVTPAILAYDPDTGGVLCEDLGSDRLHDLAMAQPAVNLSSYYQQAIQALIHFQTTIGPHRQGAELAPPLLPAYDLALMLEKESGYFLTACCQETFQLPIDDPAIKKECRQIAEQAAKAPACYLLHRDFQSRNLMVKNGQIRIIDFQGAHQGPLAYDLAALLLDPYVGLSQPQQTRLFEDYLSQLQAKIGYDPVQFRHEYDYLALQRNLQICAAFCFLTHQRQKPFFQPYIQPALFSLQRLLAKLEGARYAALIQLVNQCLAKVRNES